MSDHGDGETSGEDTAPAVPTVRERLRAAGISDERVHEHLRAGTLMVDGAVVSDLEQPSPQGSRIVFAGR